MIETGHAGEEAGGINYAEVHFDSPTLDQLAGRYMITSVPTLLAFSREEPQMETRLSDIKQITDKDTLRKWIESEASRGGVGGKGGRNPLSWLLGLKDG